MFYDVLINYTKPGNYSDTWYGYSGLTTYSEAISKCKKEIKSIYSFVYIRKRFTDKQSRECITCFKLITSLSYTFTHYPKIPDVSNAYLVSRFLECISND